MRHNCSLVLSSGERFPGFHIGAPMTSTGELVFSTGMVGYGESMTDPSYFGQVLVFTYPLIGNYGVPYMAQNAAGQPIPKGFESDRIRCSGIVISSDSPKTFHWNSARSLDEWMKHQGIPGIAGIDTRHLVHMLRERKQIFARIEPEGATGRHVSGGELSKFEREDWFDPGAHCLMNTVSTRKPQVFLPPAGVTAKGIRVGLIDCGVKANIVREVLAQGCEVELVPWDADFSKVDCSGWVISNGPGDPTNTGSLVSRVAKLLTESRPILGICLGHQLLCLAAGAKTERLKHGHRSHNQPVQELGSNRAYLTSQNHGYVVIQDSLPADWKVWFTNSNDASIEGIRHAKKPFCSVQFHPEAAAGPRDTGWIIQNFVTECTKVQVEKKAHAAS